MRRTAWDEHHDRWEGLLITFAALARGEKRLGLPALPKNSWRRQTRGSAQQAHHSAAPKTLRVS
jgi:hypothetical protein